MLYFVNLVVSLVFSAGEFLRLNPIQTLSIFWKPPIICKYYAWRTCSWNRQFKRYTLPVFTVGSGLVVSEKWATEEVVKGFFLFYRLSETVRVAKKSFYTVGTGQTRSLLRISGANLNTIKAFAENSQRDSKLFVCTKTEKPISHSSLRDSCDIGFSREI